MTMRSMLAAACAVWAHGCWAQASDPDPLSLQSAPVAEGSVPAARKLYIEGAVAGVERRYGLGSITASRLSLDYAQTFKAGPNWQFGLSDRLDYVDPVDAGASHLLNSLRESYAMWRDDSGSTSVEAGRVNVRHGPAYGYNPTDFFRTYAVRAATTVDPFALRENRMGTVMVRTQRLFAAGSVSLAYAPKLTNRGPSREGFSLDLGATNNRARWLATASGKATDKVSGEVLLYGEQDKDPQVGASFTALVSDAIVVHGEWSRGEDDDLLKLVSRAPDPRAVRSRAAAGVTVSIPTELSITAEVHYNGFATDIAAWAGSLPQRLALAGLYVAEAERRQDNAARRAWMVYATKKNLGTKNLDATALVRVNADDRSRLTWLELRYHWPGVDGAVQWQTTHGSRNEQYGLPPVRQSLQVLASWYF